MTALDVIGLLFAALGAALAIIAAILWRLVGDVAYLLWVHSDEDLHPDTHRKDGGA